ncbi:Opi1-domain-containing protein [Lactarius akahatsu]|uniref:Opi1-domain-containing protein n=1 Tax=Lactarius akahatsu TaxID=416441 RepID=A0AAD4LRW4_9AGAM|nr:Opi1-domain-containing protein [Lactarius akahatsu]
MSTATTNPGQDQDESVLIAVKALGDMRNATVLRSPTLHPPSLSSTQPTPALSVASSSNSPTMTSQTLASEDQMMMDSEEADFVGRIATFPVVSTAIRAYEQSKASSRVVKYGAEMMESSMKSISRPVIDRLPNSLDEFACRQLDRLGRYGRPPSADPDERSASAERGRKRGRIARDSPQIGDTWRKENPHQVSTRLAVAASWLTSLSESDKNMQGETAEEQQQVVPRSRWQAVLLEAGGIGAAVSEESMRRLKYCLSWLQYATTHIDGQILILRDFIASLQPPPDSPHALNPDALISQERMRQLTNVKRDVVATVRQVVDVVSKYAGGALPEPARARVRGFILHLPQAWASAARRDNVAPAPVPTRGRGSNRRSVRRTNTSGTGELSRPSSPTRHPRQNSAGANGPPVAVPPTAGSAKQAAQRILALATESLDMMRGVTGVVKDSLDRADAWVERLRVIGLQRNAVVDTESGSNSGNALSPLDLMTHRSPVMAGESTATSTAVTPASVNAMLPSVSPIMRPATTLSSSSSSLQDTFFADHHTAGISRLSLSTSTPSTPNKKDMFTEDGERVSTPKAAMEVDDE